MSIVFTLCSVNHLGRALSLGESIKRHGEGLQFYIGLVDSAVPDISTIAGSVRVINISDLNFPAFNEMCLKYTATELNSALKPYLADHLLRTHNDAENIIYFDTDMLVFSPLDIIKKNLERFDILLTPHQLSSPPDDDHLPHDRTFLQSGIFNAGFFALKRGKEAMAFLEWWKEKLARYCFNDVSKGMFGDQLWLNYVPIYFDNVGILKHVGCNVAYWNLHERIISKRQDTYYVNESVPLVFYHYSGASLDCLEKNELSKYQNRFDFRKRPDVVPLFEEYVNACLRNSSDEFERFYTVTGSIRTKSPVIKWFMEALKKILKRTVYK